MYIQVRLLKGFSEPLLYHVPDSWNEKPSIGTFVHVPIQKREESAIVEQIYYTKPITPFAIRDAIRIEPFPEDQHYQGFIKKLAYYYQTNEKLLIRRIRQFIAQTEVKEHEPDQVTHKTHNVTLTDEQEAVYRYLQSAIDAETFEPTVLHGVTGSGKTEVYKKLIEHTISNNKTALLLLPEVTLAVQFTQLLKQQLDSSIAIFSFHSATSIKEKRELWQHLTHKKPLLLIGVHLPILLPIANLGLIIIDEEHESGYQEKKHPKINSKEAALLRAQLNNIPILLGSATPSIHTLYNVQTKNWKFFELKKRFSGSFPKIELVSLNENKNRKNFWITKKLQAALEQQLRNKEQAIIFLNRRGYSFFVQCKSCSFIFNCSACSVSLTLHQDNNLYCHYCSYTRPMPFNCPECKDKEFIKKGVGTQQIVSILQKLFPTARIARADLDTTINKKRWQSIMREMQAGEIDFLVGTQTITKGYHFPKVTLVGILWADLNLHFPIYNASETTLQQLIQVAGRAGRDSQHSTVIIQAMDQHPIFQHCNEIDYIRFYESELQKRQLVNYPPATRLVEIELKHTHEAEIDREAESIAHALQQIITTQKLDIRLLGPAQPPVHKIKDWHIRKIYLKGCALNHLIALFKSINQTQFKSRIYFTPNPLS